LGSKASVSVLGKKKDRKNNYRARTGKGPGTARTLETGDQEWGRRLGLGKRELLGVRRMAV